MYEWIPRVASRLSDPSLRVRYCTLPKYHQGVCYPEIYVEQLGEVNPVEPRCLKFYLCPRSFFFEVSMARRVYVPKLA